MEAGGSITGFFTVFLFEGFIITEVLFLIPALLPVMFFLETTFFIVKTFPLAPSLLIIKALFFKITLFIVKAFPFEIALLSIMLFLETAFFVIKTFFPEITSLRVMFLLAPVVIRAAFFIIKTFFLKIALFTRNAFFITVRVSAFFIIVKAFLFITSAIAGFFFAETFIVIFVKTFFAKTVLTRLTEISLIPEMFRHVVILDQRYG